MNKANVGTAAIAATTGVGVYMSMMPDINDVRQAHPGSVTSHDTRYASIIAGVIVLGMGGLVSYMLNERTPIIIAVLTVVTLNGLYEYTLRKQP